MKPLCFVLMPFGRKTDEKGRTIDFDRVYENMIAPAAHASGLDVIRADQEEVGGSIHKPMFERLLLCEYAIADVTSANPNVYYELGVRHALKPRSTIILFANGTTLPFDVAMLRGIPYHLDDHGRLGDAMAGISAISKRLDAMRKDGSDDSPVFQLVEGLPTPVLDHDRTGLFRERTEHCRRTKERLRTARRAGAPAVRAVAAEKDFANLLDVEAGLVIDLFLSLRDVGAFVEMIDLYERMPRPLRRPRLVQEQRGFALNRLGRGDEAEAVLKAIIEEHGVSGETNGLLGRIYKDRFKDARAAGHVMRAKGELRRAIDTYLAGFEADIRDPYPGVNALALMALLDEAHPRFEGIAAVVHYSAERRARMPGADYWDAASLLEVAVITGKTATAESALSDALTRVEADTAWCARSTADNLDLLIWARLRRGEPVEDVSAVTDELRRAARAACPD